MGHSIHGDDQGKMSIPLVFVSPPIHSTGSSVSTILRFGPKFRPTED